MTEPESSPSTADARDGSGDPASDPAAIGERSFAEWLFGSTTRDLLARAEPAVFLYAERDGAEPPTR